MVANKLKVQFIVHHLRNSL